GGGRVVTWWYTDAAGRAATGDPRCGPSRRGYNQAETFPAGEKVPHDELGRVGHALGELASGRRRAGGAGDLGALLREPGRPGAQEARQRAAPRSRRGGRGAQRDGELLPRRARPDALPPPGEPRLPVARPGADHRRQGPRPDQARDPAEA